jgi:hypothetical protein
MREIGLVTKAEYGPSIPVDTGEDLEGTGGTVHMVFYSLLPYI